MAKSIGCDTKTALLRAAERLFGERGLSGVSARDIVRAAGARNESALQYHFGSRDGLIQAVFADRFRQLEAARIDRIAACEAAGLTGDLAEIMAAAIGPVIEACAEEDGRLYVKFLAQLAADPRHDIADLLTAIHPAGIAAIARHLRRLLADLPREVRELRMRRSTMISVALAADHARLVELGRAPAPEAAIREAGACLAGFLRAPPVPISTA